MDLCFHHANEYETTSYSVVCIFHCPIVEGNRQVGPGRIGREGNKRRRGKGRKALGSDLQSPPTESTLGVF